MCGIAGLASRSALDAARVRARGRAALEALEHRGPDASGDFLSSQVWLGHRRLSILDLSDAGRQPMALNDDSLVLSFNGEVYNFRDIVSSERIDGLRSGTDTEVVLRLFQQRGVDGLSQLNGMFAFAVFDQPSRRLWLVRDRFGIKPLYFRLTEDTLAFGSEVKAIRALVDAPVRCDCVALHEWLYFGNLMGHHTLYEGIESLPPGHLLELDLDTFEASVRPWWRLSQNTTSISVKPAEAIARTRELLERAVERQLVSDVPVGVFLSGGIDSSALVAFASRHYQSTLTTWSATFDFSPHPGELSRARNIARRFGCDHHELAIEGQNIGDAVERLVHHHDMPFSDAANLPLMLMAEQVSPTTRVVLQGDGGDELFGGYSRYFTLRHRAALRPLARIAALLLRSLPDGARRLRALRFARALLAGEMPETMARLLTVEVPERVPEAVLGPGIRGAIDQSDPFATFRNVAPEFDRHDIGNQMSMVDFMTVLPGRFLEKVDRSTMAASLEVRVPFLDHELVDFVAALPGEQKMPRGHRKWLLKQALRGVVPDDVLDAPKSGLTVPFKRWLLGPLRDNFQDRASAFRHRFPGVLDHDRLDTLLRRTDDGVENHAYMLWKIFNLMIWTEQSDVQFTAADHAASAA